MLSAEFTTTLFNQPTSILFCRSEFEQSFDNKNQDEYCEKYGVQSHRNRTNSELNPGPRAEIRPYSPDAFFVSRRNRSRIKKTVALDIFPKSRKTLYEYFKVHS